MSDLIDRQAALDALDKRFDSIPMEQTTEILQLRRDLRHLPSAQPELPKQFMSDDCISRSELYKNVCEAEKLAREKVLDTPSDIPFPNKLNPAYTRYLAQLDERTQFKHMIADAPSVQPAITRCKDCKHRPTGADRHDLEFPDEECPCQCEDFWYNWKPADDWFCGNGERKDDDHDVD